MMSDTIEIMGTMFLRAGIYEAHTSAGQQQWVFPLISRDGLQQQLYRAIWSGPQADGFVAAHRAQLRTGCAMTFVLHGPRCLNNEIWGVINTCYLSPKRWQHTRGAHDGAAAPDPAHPPQGREATA